MNRATLAKRKRAELNSDEKDPLPPGNPSDHYQMSITKRYPLDIHAWLAENDGDVAVIVRPVFTMTVIYMVKHPF